MASLISFPQNCTQLCSPCFSDNGEITGCGIPWRKEQLRIIVCCIITILILGLVLGDFGKVIGIVGCSIVVSLLCCKGVSWIKAWRNPPLAIEHEGQVVPVPPAKPENGWTIIDQVD